MANVLLHDTFYLQKTCHTLMQRPLLCLSPSPCYFRIQLYPQKLSSWSLLQHLTYSTSSRSEGASPQSQMCSDLPRACCTLCYSVVLILIASTGSRRQLGVALPITSYLHCPSYRRPLTRAQKRGKTRSSEKTSSSEPECLLRAVARAAAGQSAVAAAAGHWHPGVAAPLSPLRKLPHCWTWGRVS